MDFSAIDASLSWSKPTGGTPDLFCKCDRKTKILREKAYSYVDVPQNPMGFQEAHSGHCYAGFFLLSHGEYREYLQTPLNTTLEKNKTYSFSMYISLADYSAIAIDQLGLCFLKSKSDYYSTNVITNLDPVYIKIEEEPGMEVDDWHQVTATYIAGGGECYLLLGSFEINKITKTNFRPPEKIKSRINQSVPRDAYYYIDDLSLVEIYSEEPEDKAEKKAEPGSGSELTETEVEDSLLVLKNVLFQTNEALLLPSSYSELDILADYLKKNPQVEIKIFGHTDNSGVEKANKKLSTVRAKAVGDYLISRGIEQDRIDYEGCGSSRPVATNDTEEGKQQNRRVEFIMSRK